MDRRKILSLCIITKDNEKHLSNSLQIMKEFVDEILIVDIGSKDSTVDIAKRAGANVYQIEWKNDYSEAKNICFEKADGRWILFLNGNEMILSDQLKKVYSFLDNPNVEAYLLHLEHPIKKHRISSPVESMRLIRNRKEYSYKYKAFERISDELLSNIQDAGIQIIQQSNDSTPNKIDMRTLLLEEDINENPQDGYLQYMYGIELLNIHKYEEAIVYFKKSWRNVNFDYLYAPHLYKCLSWALMYTKEYEEALNIIEEGIKEFPFYTDLLVLRGEVKKHFKQYEQAIDDLEKSLKTREQIKYIVPKPEINISTILETLGDIYENISKYKQALDYYNHAIQINKTNKKLLYKIDNVMGKIKL